MALRLFGRFDALFGRVLLLCDYYLVVRSVVKEWLTVQVGGYARREVQHEEGD